MSARLAVRGLADQLELPALLSAVDSALHQRLVTLDGLLALEPPWRLRAEVALVPSPARSPTAGRVAAGVASSAGRDRGWAGPVELQVLVEVDGVIYRGGHLLVPDPARSRRRWT